MENLFGVTDAETGRIKRTGQWVPSKTEEPSWYARPDDAPDESIFTTDTLKGKTLGQKLNITLVSPRPCKVTTGKVLIKTVSGQPGVINRNVGKGKIFLLGFCLQDTYFKTWQDENKKARDQLRGLIQALTKKAGLQAHVYSSNPDIEASVRANEHEGFLFVINHEAENIETTVQLADLDFKIDRITNLADDRLLKFRKKRGCIEMNISVPVGETRLFHLTAE